jgi:hypothetical protein
VDQDEDPDRIALDVIDDPIPSDTASVRRAPYFALMAEQAEIGQPGAA